MDALLEALDAYIDHRKADPKTDAEHAAWLNHATFLWQQVISARAAIKGNASARIEAIR